MFEDLLRPLEYFAATAIDGAADLFGFRGQGLRAVPTDGTVRIPEDLYAKPDVQTEWWYYTGHCKTETGRELGFELVFFKRRTDLDRLGIFPVAAFGNPIHFAHFAISDIETRSFKYEHIRSFNRPFDLDAVMSETSYNIQLGQWSIREVAGKHLLHATLNGGVVFDAILEPSKAVVLNGDGGSGISKKRTGASNHFSYTRMKATGRISRADVSQEFSGSAWMDREFGIWEQEDWDWFSLQFDDDTELMVYQFRGEGAPASTGTFVRVDGTCHYLEAADFEVEILSTWLSNTTGAEYPSKWRISVPVHGLDIVVEPLIDDQELDTRGTTMIVYWEGACRITGTRNGEPIGGQAYVELVGYDRSHEQISLADFLFGGTISKFKEMLPI